MEKHNDIQTPEEKFSAVTKLTLSIEDNFIALGQLLSDIKRSKIFLHKGYEKFSDYVSAEYHFNLGLVNKLIGIYELFAKDMDMDDVELVNIGFDRLCMIKPLVAKSGFADRDLRDVLIAKAAELPSEDLKIYLKELKTADKETEIDLKKVFIEQYYERILPIMNCSRKELNFKLALYFNGFGEDEFAEIKTIVKTAQRRFEQDVSSAVQEDDNEGDSPFPRDLSPIDSQPGEEVDNA